MKNKQMKINRLHHKIKNKDIIVGGKIKLQNNVYMNLLKFIKTQLIF